jgi:hypothetical protein
MKVISLPQSGGRAEKKMAGIGQRELMCQNPASECASCTRRQFINSETPIALSLPFWQRRARFLSLSLSYTVNPKPALPGWQFSIRLSVGFNLGLPLVQFAIQPETFRN